MITLNIWVTIFIVFALSRVILRFNNKEISFRETFFWLVIWMSILLISLFPNITTSFAQIIGIKRGLDSVILVAILILFYLIFRLYMKINNLDKDITELNTKISKELHCKKNNHENLLNK